MNADTQPSIVCLTPQLVEAHLLESCKIDNVEIPHIFGLYRNAPGLQEKVTAIAMDACTAFEADNITELTGAFLALLSVGLRLGWYARAAVDDAVFFLDPMYKMQQPPRDEVEEWRRSICEL